MVDNIQNDPVGLAVVKDRTAVMNNPYQAVLVKELIHEALLQSGLGKKNKEIPFADIIQPGMSVMLKPNLVLHFNQSGASMDCMITHPVFIAAVVEEVALAGAGKIMIGDAPLQGCDWNSLFPSQSKELICNAGGRVPVEFRDFRRTIMVRQGDTYHALTDLRSLDEYVLFDLGSDSLLEPISEPVSHFRVTMYDPEKLAQNHQPGIHRYLITKDVLQADAVINLPKLKTHRKAGITAALKNLVGINGNKDFLPHHRIGGSDRGGDCYPTSAPWRNAVELYLDRANQHINEPGYDFWRKRVNDLIGLFGRFEDIEFEGGWYGNDTIWRTVLDLNRILVYGQVDGRMSDIPQRRVWNLTDAIVCGDGEGPLAPNPLMVGAVVSSGNPVNADLVNAALLRFDPQKIPTVREASKQFRWSIKPSEELPGIYLRGKPIALAAVASKYGVKARPARGWVSHVEFIEEKSTDENTAINRGYRMLRRTARRMVNALTGS